MRAVTFIIIFLQAGLIVFAKVAERKYYNSDFSRMSTEKWIALGNSTMKYRTIPVLFFFSLLLLIWFYKEKWWIKGLIFILSLIGFWIWNFLYLYPF